MEIETERLIIRPVCVDDAKDIFEYASRSVVGPLAGFKVHKSIDETISIIDNILKIDAFAIVLKKENKVIGLVSASQKLDKVFELGYSINEYYWNLGYATEASKALIGYMFKNNIADEFNAGCALDNYRSENVILKCGFKYVGIHEKDFKNYDDKWIDAKRFILVKKDYKEE